MEEVVDPRHTALLVVDMQNDFYAEGGVDQKYGRHLSNGNMLLEKLKFLIQEGRKAGVRIVYIQQTRLPSKMSSSGARVRFEMRMFGLDDPTRIPEFTLEGSWGEKIIEEIKPSDGDLIVKKHRSSAFLGTDMDMLLRANNIKTTLITGTVTEGCVDATARDALHHDYFVVVVRDCVDSTRKDLHDAALKIMETRFDVVDSVQLTLAWKKSVPIVGV